MIWSKTEWNSLYNTLIFGQICYSKIFMFTVLSFDQVTNIFGLFYSIILQGQIQSSFFGHINSPRTKLKLIWYLSDFSEWMLAQRHALTMRPSSGQSPEGSTATLQLGRLLTEAIDHKPLQRWFILMIKQCFLWNNYSSMTLLPNYIILL